MHVDASYVTHLEAGKKTPSLGMVETIANALQVPVYVFILMSSSDEDLNGIDVTDAKALGQGLLDLFPTKDGLMR